MTNGSDLFAQVEEYGLSYEFIAEKTGYKVLTLKQNFKKSVHPSNDLISAIEKLTRDCLIEARLFINKVHKESFSQVKLNIYSSILPNIDIDDLAPTPRLFSAAQPISDSESIPPISWANWKETLWSRFHRLSNEHSDVHGGDKITMIMGSPGAGKTTVLKRLIRECPENITMMFVPLGDYNFTEGVSPQNGHQIASIEEIIADYYTRRHRWNLPIPIKKFIEHETKAQRLVVLADAFDEAVLERRHEIWEQLCRTEMPIVVTSRYVAPRLDSHGVGACYHIGSLSLEDIKSHIGSITSKIHHLNKFTTVGQHESSGNAGSISEPLDKLIKVISEETGPRPNDVAFQEKEVSLLLPAAAEATREFPQSPEHELVGTLLPTNPDRFSQHAQTLSEKRRYRRELIRLLTTPILLNLYVASLLDSSYHKLSVTGLLERYAEFLFGTWKNSRTEHVDPTDTTLRDIFSILSLSAFLILISQHCNGRILGKAELKKRLVEYIKFVLPAGTKDIPNFIGRLLQEAYDAEMLRLNNSSNCRFNAPHELFCSYYAAKFIQSSESVIKSRAFINNIGPDQVKYHPSYFASHSRIIENPNLRFLQETAVFYLQLQAENHNLMPVVLEDMFWDVISTPPIKEMHCNLSNDELEQIVPLNLIMLSRVFSSHSLQRRFPHVHKELKSRVANLIGKTNFEYVYQSLLPVFRNLNCEETQTYKGFKALERDWRTSNNCSKLLEVWNSVDEIISRDEQACEADTRALMKDIIRRRVIYKTRHHFDSFNSTIFKLLTDYDQEYSGGGVTKSRCLLVLNTLRMVADNFCATDQIECSELKDDVRKWVDERITALRDHRQSLKIVSDSISSQIEQGNFSVSSFFSKLITKNEESIPFEVMKIYPSIIKDCIPRTDHDLDVTIQKMMCRLGELQKQRLETGSEQESDAAEEASIVYLMMLFADSFHGQQFFLPSEYALIGLYENYPEVNYSRSELLRLLFTGAKAGLPKTLDGQEQSFAHSVGGWQLYDIYVQAIWRIMHYVPSDAHYDYIY